jgi:hypothetical protein
MNNAVEATLEGALAQLTCINSRYMTLPIHEGFNWLDSFAYAAPGEWYLVVFRSRQRKGIDYGDLTARDERAQHEALHAPGFLYYFAGTPDEQGNCLSFCLWESQALARSASQRPNHQQARQLADSVYEHFQLERYFVRKTDEADLVFERL